MDLLKGRKLPASRAAPPAGTRTDRPGDPAQRRLHREGPQRPLPYSPSRSPVLPGGDLTCQPRGAETPGPREALRRLREPETHSTEQLRARLREPHPDSGEQAVTALEDPERELAGLGEAGQQAGEKGSCPQAGASRRECRWDESTRDGRHGADVALMPWPPLQVKPSVGLSGPQGCETETHGGVRLRPISPRGTSALVRLSPGRWGPSRPFGLGAV
ncbi:uncharacterized protein LOC144221858 [Crocuta crocuta]